jgi:hypothetical protein
VPATLVCPSELGDGVTTKRRFCDVLTGLDPSAGVVITVPPHRGPVTLSFEVHNRHTYSAELVKKKQGYRHYTATIGVLLMDGTLIDRAVVDSEFRTERDLYDRWRPPAPSSSSSRCPRARSRRASSASASRLCGPTGMSSSRRLAARWPRSAT